MTNYKTGTVAKMRHVNLPEKGEFLAIRGVDSSSGWFSAEYGYTHESAVTDIRPLVVLDLDDPVAAVGYLRDATDGFENAAYQMQAWSGREPLRKIAHQIEAQTKPPKPQREKGWYEVDDDGTVRVYWWDGSGWRYGPDGAGPLVVEGGGSVRVTRLDVA